MGLTDRDDSPQVSTLGVLLTLSLGAVLGIVAAAFLLGRKAKRAAEESDDPLFI